MNNVKRFEDSKKQREAEYERQVLLQHLKSKEKEQLEINRLDYLIKKTDSITALTFYNLPPVDEDVLRRYVELKQLKKRRTRNWIDKKIMEKLERIDKKIMEKLEK